MPIRHARLEVASALELDLANGIADARRRTARDIHAGVLQRLAAMGVILSSAVDDYPSNAEMLHGIGAALDAATSELTETISDAAPALIADQGLGGALATCAAATTATVDIDDRLSRRHPARAELAVYFACREALQNVLKHGGTVAHVKIRLSDEHAGAGGVRFAVRDDGAGFHSPHGSRGFGLLGIRERIESAGGTVKIWSAAGKGVLVSGFVPDRLSVAEASGAQAQWAVAHVEPQDELTARRAVLLETDAERRRIMRDLHDGAQQSLVALRVRIGLGQERAPAESRDAQVLDRLANALDLAIAELSDLARGLLIPSGDLAVAHALRRVTRHWSMQVRVRERNLRRHAQAVEAAVYGCVLDTLQDARDDASETAETKAIVSLFEAPGTVHFVVRGRGTGFDIDRLNAAHGARYVEDRATVAGGSLSLRPTPTGVVMRGSIPLSGAA